MLSQRRKTRLLNGFSLLELMAAVSILGVLATLALTTISGVMDDGHQAACSINQAEIEIQCQRWHRATGSYPGADLSSIESDLAYFPEGLPTCPADGTTYTIDNATGLVVGHNH